MSFAAKIWLVVLIAVTLITLLCSVLLVPGSLLLGGSAIVVTAIGFGVSLLIENERRYKKRLEKLKKQEAAEKARQNAEHNRVEQQKAAEQVRRMAEQTRWREEHGYMTVPVANTTFSNLDKSSRQKILAEAYDAQLADPFSQLDVQLEKCDLAGTTAICVLLLGRCIGTIPNDSVEEVEEIMEDAQSKQLTVDYIVPFGEKRRIYTAELTISNWKHP